MAVNVGDEFWASEICRQSGIYQVSHDPPHAQKHEVTCIKGKRFPRCRNCGHPRFVLVKAARRVEAHEFFKGVL